MLEMARPGAAAAGVGLGPRAPARTLRIYRAYPEYEPSAGYVKANRTARPSRNPPQQRKRALLGAGPSPRCAWPVCTTSPPSPRGGKTEGIDGGPGARRRPVPEGIGPHDPGSHLLYAGPPGPPLKFGDGDTEVTLWRGPSACSSDAAPDTNPVARLRGTPGQSAPIRGRGPTRAGRAIAPVSLERAAGLVLPQDPDLCSRWHAPVPDGWSPRTEVFRRCVMTSASNVTSRS